MSPKNGKQSKCYLASSELADAYMDFYLSRQAMNCTKATLTFYDYTARVFLQWIEAQGITCPKQITAKEVRRYIASLKEMGKADKTLHAHARAIKTLLRFFHQEKYMENEVHFEMPRLEKRRLLVLSVEDIQRILEVCNLRDKAIFLFLLDSGVRRQELVNLCWSNINMENGLVIIHQGKGMKDRSTVVGIKTRQALLKYKKTMADWSESSPLFQPKRGGKFTGTGLLLIFRRLSKKTGIKVNVHSCRRSFVGLSVKNGQDVLTLQRMLGHSSLQMVSYYLSMSDDDLIQSHSAHSPIDLLR